MKIKSMKIKIAKELGLPLDGITQTYAQIGKRGSGKTYLASMIAEQMLDVQAQVIVVDPIGNWWGLRVDADGKSKGKDIFIIGGSHGDVPLSSEGGKEIAKLLVEKNLSVVLDISEFRKNERKKFVTDFAEEFYQLKKSNPSAVHIFLEESQKFVPQIVRGDEARMVGAWEDIVRLGRNYGIGCSLISQRPQSVNKEVLSQVECLCVLQVVGRHERKALEEWIREAGEDRSIVDKLPSLHQGEGYVWSPSWLRVFKKVHFNKKTTFDTSATPKLGEATKSAKISKIDIEKLREQMTKVVEKISKEKMDRKSLIDEINRLKFELRKKPKDKPLIKVDEKGLERARSQGLKEAEREMMKEINFLRKENTSLIGLMNKIGDLLKVKVVPRPEYSFQPKTLMKQPPIKENFNQPIQQKPSVSKNLHQVSDYDGEYELNLCERKLYSLLFQYSERSFSKPQVGVFTGYSCKSGGFNNAISHLRQMGLIEGSGSELRAKELNSDIAQEFDFSKEAIISKLNKCEGEIYHVLLENPEETFGKEELAEATETQYSAKSGGFNNAISRLNTLGLMQRTNGMIKLNPELLEI